MGRLKVLVRRGVLSRLIAGSPPERALGILTVAALILLAWFVTWAAGGANHMPPHLFYVPVLAAATWWGPAGILAVVALSTVAAGPLLPASTASGAAQLPSDWLLRGVFFLLMAQLMGLITRALRRAMEREHLLARREAELAADKDALLRGLSHELRTPIAILTGSASMLQNPALSERTSGELWAAHGRALRRLETLLSVAVVLNDPDREPDLDHFVLGGVADVQIAALPRVDTDRVLFSQGAAQVVRSDPVLVGLLLRLLIDNALRYSPADERVDLTAASRGGTRVQVAVTDRGPGIEPGEIERLMGAFAQGSNDGSNVQGLGLGLAAASRIAHDLGTELIVTPAPDGGTRIAFELEAGELRPTTPLRQSGRHGSIASMQAHRCTGPSSNLDGRPALRSAVVDHTIH